MTPPPHSLSTPVLSWEADGGTQLVSAAPLIDHSQRTSAADFKGLVAETRINLYSAIPLHWDIGVFLLLSHGPLYPVCLQSFRMRAR